ncbi:unnamed protein product [Rotaria magnacalcarata]|uniref:Uncharacterized protein n=3 Tax=Rotaria magnacalcarata TaxID=392030 RepID=A0A819SP50_9BILA|nr:unnamed protein product [Rotaria magnacalcarata]CAF4182621.1 unnamed protein product [Rotaria magnacalcarata]
MDFWGTVSAGSSMFLLHIIQLYFVMSLENKIILSIAFASVGGINTITESPIYGIAGLFKTGSFTQVVQVGNGMAGFLNVTANTIIRLIVLLVHSKIDQDQLSFYIFMSVLIIFF